MPQTINQRNSTRNQSTADFEVKRIFIFDNRFQNGIYKNTTGATATLLSGMLVARSATVANGYIPVTYTDATTNNLNDVIGIVALEDPAGVSLANNATLNINIGVKGTIDGNRLTLPAGVTLNTVVTASNKTLRDVLEDIGFHVDVSTVENTKFDN